MQSARQTETSFILINRRLMNEQNIFPKKKKLIGKNRLDFYADKTQMKNYNKQNTISCYIYIAGILVFELFLRHVQSTSEFLTQIDRFYYRNICFFHGNKQLVVYF